MTTLYVLLAVLFLGAFPWIVIGIARSLGAVTQTVVDRKDQEQEQIKRDRQRDERMKKKLGLKEEHSPDRYWNPD